MLIANYSGCRLEAGVDEVGRGAAAGPVVACAVILPPDFHDARIRDSKLLTPRQREVMSEVIKREAMDWSLGDAPEDLIDEINISEATFFAMRRAIDALKVQPEFLLIDGHRFPGHTMPHACLVKGDRNYLSIAAASIVAKTHRDALMTEFHKEYPMYEWARNKGYPTATHRIAILRDGLSKYHRRTYKTCIF